MTSRDEARDLAARAWAEIADLTDLQLSPLGLRAIEALAPRTGEAVLDVGCGAGQSVLQLADRVGTGGSVTGVDIAPPLLEIARRRAAGRGQVDFIECDAQKLALADAASIASFRASG
jgi:ubiquinone/menaquinone biosynthesis C-methylase UbiE